MLCAKPKPWPDSHDSAAARRSRRHRNTPHEPSLRGNAHRTGGPRTGRGAANLEGPSIGSYADLAAALGGLRSRNNRGIAPPPRRGVREAVSFNGLVRQRCRQCHPKLFASLSSRKGPDLIRILTCESAFHSSLERRSSRATAKSPMPTDHSIVAATNQWLLAWDAGLVTQLVQGVLETKVCCATLPACGSP